MLLLVLRVRLTLVVLLLLLLLLLLVLQPRGISRRILVLMREDVLALRLEHGEGTVDEWFRDLVTLRRVGLPGRQPSKGSDR